MPPTRYPPARGRGEVLSPSRASWLPARGQPTEKLCVHVSVSLRARLDRAQRALSRYPDIAGVLRSRNALIAYACHRLRLELDVVAGGLPDPASSYEEPSRRRRPGSTDVPEAPPSPGPRWAEIAPLYRMPWEADFAERRCQLTLRVPPPFAAQLRALHTALLAAPKQTLRPELAGVFTFSELVALGCHELCDQIEADTPRP